MKVVAKKCSGVRDHVKGSTDDPQASPPREAACAGSWQSAVSETVPAGWQLTSATCDDGSDPSAIVLAAGETVTCTFTNERPGGEPRTPGYWKNWNTCTPGNQEQIAAANGGPEQGWFLLDDLIPTSVGDLAITTCEDGVSILDRRDLSSGRKRASDAAYNLASHLLAAKLNLKAGAKTCLALEGAVEDGDALLADIGFDGTGPLLRRGADRREEALDLAATLDRYNNGELC